MGPRERGRWGVRRGEAPRSKNDMRRLTRRLTKNERGAALLETAITIPLILLISVAIFEFGRAYQTWQVLTNAAREGARIAILNGTTDDQVRGAVNNYMSIGQLSTVSPGNIDVNRAAPLGANTGSQITVNYPVQLHGARTGDEARQPVGIHGLYADDVGGSRNAKRKLVEDPHAQPYLCRHRHRGPRWRRARVRNCTTSCRTSR